MSALDGRPPRVRLDSIDDSRGKISGEEVAVSGIQDGVMTRDDLFGRLSRGGSEALDEVRRRYGERVAQIVRGAVRGDFPSESAFVRWVMAQVEQRILRAAGRISEDRAAEPVQGGRSRKRGLRSGRPGQVAGPERADRVTMALSRLTPPDREVIIGRIILQLPWDAMAQSLGLSVDAAQMRLVRARRRAAAILGERDFPSRES